jgi:protein gp37
MADETSISWADMTFNPWIGCTRVSPACDGCYAAHLMETRLGRVAWGGPGKGNGTRARTSIANWKKPLAWNRKAKAAGTRPFVFCASLADVFDNQVPAEWRADLFALIRATPHLVWLLLTKRPQLIVRLSDAAGGLPANAAIGTTVEDQPRAEANLTWLKVAEIELSPLFTFGSLEPLVSGVVIPEGMMPGWVITGGETDQGAHKARPSHPQWFRDLRDQCAAAGVPFHHKQNGEWVSVSEVAGPGEHFTFPDGATVRRTGKHLSGRTIDHVEHNAFPEVRT